MVTFTISVEDEDFDAQAVLEDLEEVISKHGLSLDDSSYEEE